jgi:hypothetical protein
MVFRDVPLLRPTIPAPVANFVQPAVKRALANSELARERGPVTGEASRDPLQLALFDLGK